MTRSALLAVLVLMVPQLHGQHHHRDCAAHHLTQRYLTEQGLSGTVADHLPRVAPEERGGTFTIPVVVHVVWNTAAENVPTSAITAIIEELNRDYSQSNTDLSSVRSSFQGVIGNVGFQFCLAQVDPQGNPTTGIVRVQTTDTWFDPDTQTNAMKSAPLGSAAWNPSQYLNIWVCDITSGSTGGFITVGYAYLPVGGVVGSSIDGLVIDVNYGLDIGARTATHEIGHYFGLQHTFDDGGECTNTDGFADTPTSDSPTYTCSNTNLVKCGVLTQYENFMDYSNCTAMFTDQQAAYMQGVLAGVRSALLNNNACSVAPTGYCIPTSTFGTGDGDYINSVQLGTINNSNSGGTGVPTYTDYSASFSATLLRGSTHTITIQSGNYTPDQYAAWIDLDQDELFEPGELLGEFTNSAVGASGSFTFTIPTGATLGQTRMRVRGVYHGNGEPSPTDPCFNYAYGETEDYGIVIAENGGGAGCIPTSVNGTNDGDFINGVLLNTLINLNSGSQGGPTYTDYSNTLTTELRRGLEYGIVVQSGTYTTDHIAAWIDFDQDGTWEDAEKLGEATTTSANETVVLSFTVPAGATLGGTTLRVRCVYHDLGEPSPTTPCFDHAYGETEDYAIVVLPAPSGQCIPTSLFGTLDGDYINSVQLNTINNSNSGAEGAPSYSDLSAVHSTSLLRGETHQLTVQSGAYLSDTYSAWIDIDQDDVFEPNERIGLAQSTTSFEVLQMPFILPANAPLGNTVMRVRGVFVDDGDPDPVDPCFNYAYGETEDYLVTIESTTSVGTHWHDGLNLMPNPATEQCLLVHTSAAPLFVEILDMQGRLIASLRATSDRTELPVGGLAAGQYMVRVTSAEGVHSMRLQRLAN